MGYGRNSGGWKFVLLIVAIVGFVAVTGQANKGKQRAVAGITDPVQTEAAGQTKLYVDGYDIAVSYLYAYDISALVVSTHNYNGSGIGDKLAPRDLALAWGDVAAYNTVVDFHWQQSGRWYSWRVDSDAEVAKVGGIQGVTEHSPNNHLIAADDTVKKLMYRLEDVMEIGGAKKDIVLLMLGGISLVLSLFCLHQCSKSDIM
mgnify:CR=1 FL=1